MITHISGDTETGEYWAVEYLKASKAVMLQVKDTRLIMSIEDAHDISEVLFKLAINNSEAGQ